MPPLWCKENLVNTKNSENIMTTVIASKDPSEELQESQELLPLKVRKLATDLIEAIFRYSLPSKK